MLEEKLLKRLSPTGRTMYHLGLGLWLVAVVASIFAQFFQRLSRTEAKGIVAITGLLWGLAWGGACMVIWPNKDRPPRA